MKQSRLMSLVESVVNVLIGYSIAVSAQILVFPWFGLHATVRQNLLIGLIFTGVSIVRSFVLRRMFESFRGYRRHVYFRDRFADEVVAHCLMRSGGMDISHRHHGQEVL